MYSNGQWKRFAPTSITGAWDGAPSTLAAPPATGFTGTISGRALEAHAVAFYPVPGYNPLGRESALEAHAVAR